MSDPEQKPTPPGRLIALTLLLGALMLTGFLVWYTVACDGGDVEGGWCGTVHKTFPWTLLTALVSAPAVVLMWLWRERHKRADLEVAQDGQVTERYTRAVEQLGSMEMPIRLGGILALERVVRDCPRDRWTVLGVLAAFVRHRSPWQELTEDPPAPDPVDGEDASDLGPLEGIAPALDVQTALSAIGRLGVEEKGRGVDLRGTDLRGALLTGACLAWANLDGAHLEAANLDDANLRGASLDSAHLQEARLVGTNVSEAFLGMAHLDEAMFVQADLRDATLSLSHLRRAALSSSNATGADFEGAEADGLYFEKMNLTDARLWDIDLTSAKGLTRTQLEAASFHPSTKLPPEFADLIHASKGEAKPSQREPRPTTPPASRANVNRGDHESQETEMEP